ncbi:integral membrane protein MviN [Kocuria rosea]|nr:MULTISPECIES: lipid II flippase MurJ [Kocuria]MEB2526026.1 lipid II flippase MurJ [Kocuria rosea]MEB2616917.1 lipid II flippase MurJ [Kocuria rosea]TQN38806.1 putative peptidoglycan lipid II flippase [Kocuria rosea]STX07329.1 integral membrane protein MviN [Kocuria rosea]VEH41481.1 integral membrane protein MviN [Kocuria rosea]
MNTSSTSSETAEPSGPAGKGTPAAPARRSGAASSAIMASGTLVSRALGFVKTVLITVAIGSITTVSDVFELANTLPNLIYVLVAGGIFNAVLVPQIIKASRTADDGGADYIARLLTLAVLALLGVTAVVVLLAGPIIRTMGTDWTEEQLSLGLTFALFTFPQIFFYGLYTVVGQVLNARGAFGWYMWAPVVNNVVAIAALLVFVQQFGAYAETVHTLENWSPAKTFWLAAMATVGVAAQALVLFWPLRRLGLGLRPKFGWRGIGLSTAARLAGWTLATGVLANLAFLTLTKVAAIPTGYRPEYLAMDPPQQIAGVAALNQASMLYSLPHGVIGLSIATVLFNRMAAASTDGDRAGMVASLSSSLRITGVATVFATVALVVFAGPLGMLFSGGVPSAGAVVGQVITVIAIGAPFMSVSFMLGRAFYAQEDARTPFLVQVGVALFTVVSALLIWSFVPPDLIVFAVAACYAAQNVLSALIYHVVLVRRIGDYDVARIVDSHARILVASLLAGAVGAVALFLLGGYDPAGFPWTNQLTAIATVAAGGTVMGIAYLGALKLCRVRELDSLVRPLLARLGR